MVLIGKSLNKRRAAQVERRAACAAAAAAGRASSASPVPPPSMSSLPSAGLSPTLTAAASGTDRADETLITPTTDRTTEIFFNAAALSDITAAVATPANRLAPVSTSAMVTNTGSAHTLTLPGPKTITGPAYRPIREALASQLLVNRAHIVVGRNKKNGWLDFYNKTLGIMPSHQPAVMAAYKPYANEKPQTKFEKFALAGIAYGDNEHSRKVLIGDPVDHLEDCTHQVAREIQESVRFLVEESLAAAEHAAELHVNNKTSELAYT